MARKWMKTFYGGGSRIPKILTKDHMKPNIHELMILLHQAKDWADILVFKESMFNFIDIFLTTKQFLEKPKLIASSLRSHLKHLQDSK